MDGQERGLVPSAGDQRHGRQEGHPPGRCRRGWRALLAGAVPVLRTGREAARPWEDGLAQAAYDREPRHRGPAGRVLSPPGLRAAGGWRQRQPGSTVRGGACYAWSRSASVPTAGRPGVARTVHPYAGGLRAAQGPRRRERPAPWGPAGGGGRPRPSRVWGPLRAATRSGRAGERPGGAGGPRRPGPRPAAAQASHRAATGWPCTALRAAALVGVAAAAPAVWGAHGRGAPQPASLGPGAAAPGGGEQVVRALGATPRAVAPRRPPPGAPSRGVGRACASPRVAPGPLP